MEDKRIADYFVIAGVPPQPRTFDLASSLPPVTEPITDLAVIIRSNSEPVPKGFICIEETPTGHKADLNHGSIRSPSVFLCIKRGRDRPPLVDVGVFYDDGKERVIPQCRVIRETPSGFPANVNNSGTKTFLTYRRLEPNAPANQLVVTDIVVILSNKGETPPHAFMLIEKNLNKGMFGSDVYLCYKKSMDRPPFIAFPPVIVDRFPLADHASFSLSEHLPNFCLPMGATVECWPATAARPSPAPSTFILTQNSGEKVYASLLNFYEPVTSPAELTRPELKALGYIEEDFPDEEEEVVPVNPEKSLQQIKSICLLSHWPFFDQFKRFLLFLYKTFCSTSSLSSSSIPPASTLESYIFHFMRDIPFPSPERPNILVNLCSVRGGGGGGSLANGSDHLPSIQETTLLFTQTFDDLPIPSNGASFRRMLFNLGPENCLHALLFALTEQKILLHSLRPSVLTEVAEAITTIIFPLNWHCPYIPMCPMSMSQYLHAPLPFIFGIDSRYFDYFLPPSDVASIDIDTKAIYLSESKRHLNMKMLPRKETKQLRAVLETIYERFRNGGPYDFSTFNTSNRTTDLNARRKLERQIETEIQEAFLVFMASILRDFRHYLKPITAAPSVGATDPGSLFDLAGFVASRHPATQPFYEALTRTQMFTKFIEERSLVSDKNVSLAFFDECVEKVERWERAQRSKVNSGSTGSAIAPLSLLTDGDDGVNGGGGGCGGGSSGEGNKTVFITIPEHSVPSTPTTTASSGVNGGQENGVVERSLAVKQSCKGKLSDKFGPFDHQKFYRLMKEHSSASRSPFQLAEGNGGGSLGGDGVDQPDSAPFTNYTNSTTTTTTSELATYMFARRAKHEIRKAQRTAALARRQSPVEWAKHLLLNAYSLWFTHFPAYSHLLMQESKMKKKTTPVKPLSLAYQVLQRMQALSVRHPDEFCYRILMILCGIHSQPALAVKVFLDMQRHQVRLNAITYGYYNKAVLEGNWPGTTGTGGNDDEEESGGSPFGRALLKWAKLRNTVRVVFHLSRAHINKRSSKEEAEEEEEKRVKRNLLPLFSTAASNETATSEGQTSRERSTSGCSSSKSEQEEHKSELKSEEEEEDATDQPITTNGNAAAVHQRVVTAKEVNGVLTISVKDAAISPSSATTLNTTTATTTTTSTSSSDTSSSSLSSTSSSSSSSSSSSAAKSSSTSSSEEEEATANVQPDADNDSNSTFSSRIFGTPLKEALNSSMDFFSPKSRFGLGIRSSFRIAKSFAKPTKYNLPRSSTFGPSENGGGSVKSTRPESTTSTPSRPALPRSSTLPQSFSSSSDVLNRGNNGSTPLNDNSTRTLGTLPSSAATSTPSATATADFSPFWTNKSYSALKNYANLFASSPVKLNMVSAMTTSSNYLISQIKNFAFDEDGDAGANSTMNDREEEEAMLNGFGGVDGAETEDNFELLDRYAELFTTLAEHYSTAVDSLRRRKKGRNEEEETEDSSPEIVFRLWMMSATVCRFCASVLYDEEIMCQWGPEDSNLNTRCIHCHAAFPPSLTIYPQDYRSGECQDRLEPISVPYLSPLVLRKELETILSGEGYGSLIRAHFLDSHPIVYWNLLWYFSRINLPSHIPALVLTAASINSGALKGDSKAVYDHRNVSVVCLVDSEQLYSGSTPMHWRWMKMKNEQSAANSTSNSTTTAEVPSSSSSPSDGEIIPQLVEYIRSRKVITPLQYLISERSTEKTKTTTAAAAAGTRRFNSIYRELLFMAQLELPEQISSATFDKDYHEAFESLTSKEKESLDALDRPPSIGAIFCRMLFKQLELLPITTTTTT